MRQTDRVVCQTGVNYRTAAYLPTHTHTHTHSHTVTCPAYSFIEQCKPQIESKARIEFLLQTEIHS